MPLRYGPASSKGRTITGFRNITVTNGNGESGNPTLECRETGSTITFNSTLTLDLNKAFHVVVATDNFTIANPTNSAVGRWGKIMVIQDGTGSRTITGKGASVVFPGGAVSLTSSANAIDLLEYVVAPSGVLFVWRVGAAFS